MYYDDPEMKAMAMERRKIAKRKRMVEAVEDFCDMDKLLGDFIGNDIERADLVVELLKVAKLERIAAMLEGMN